MSLTRMQTVISVISHAIKKKLLLFYLQVLLEVISQSNINCKTNEGNMCTNDSVRLLQPNELKTYILAALSTNQYKSLFSIINLNFVDSPSHSHFKAPWELDSSTDTGISKEAIGLYVCICILAGSKLKLVYNTSLSLLRLTLKFSYVF